MNTEVEGIEVDLRASGPSITWSGTGAKDIRVGGNGVAGGCIRVLHCR